VRSHENALTRLLFVASFGLIRVNAQILEVFLNISTPEDLAKLVRSRRKELGLTQVELAELAGVSSRFVFDLENAKPSVAMDRVRAVTRTLGLTITMQVTPID
jgi:HTH-type transcriptional regulator / antitoxin HipB